jgi:GDP/UDP-N,N'-diacetylbacillosamine 2-epimerase (hydrolysing)
MIEVIKEYKQFPSLKIFPNIPHKDYLSLLCHVSVLIGNSSSALIEAPSFGLPVVNIGTRQMGRERADNVIDTVYDRKNITECIVRAMHDKKFRKKVKLRRNPYGDGEASEKIGEILPNININLLLKFNQTGEKIST